MVIGTSPTIKKPPERLNAYELILNWLDIIGGFWTRNKFVYHFNLNGKKDWVGKMVFGDLLQFVNHIGHQDSHFLHRSMVLKFT